MQYQVQVASSPDLIWQLISDISGWHRMSRYHGPARWSHGKPWIKGSQFQIEVRHPLRDTVICTVQQAEPPHSMTWSSEGLGVRVQRHIRIDDLGNGLSQITTQAGIVSGHLDWSIEPAIELFSTEWLQAIKAYAESLPNAVASNQ